MTDLRRPQLVLHVGTPKTGTTTLQHALDASRSRLQARSTLYPDIDLSHELKHQWMVNLLMAGDIDGFRRNTGSVVEAARTAGTNRVVLSTEGLFHHWSDFTPDARREIGALRALFDLTVWVVFREPVSFATSLYSQILKNPPSPHLTPLYATTLSLNEAVLDPWFAARLDYAGFVRDIEALFGEPCVVATKYESADILTQARTLLGVDAATLPGVSNRNHGLNALGAELLRRTNALTLDGAERQRLVDSVVAIDHLLGRGEPQIASGEVAATVARLSRSSVRYLDVRFGIRWSPPGASPGLS